MEICDARDYTFVRLEPEEPIIESLKAAARKHNIRVGIITSGVGMLSAVRFGFFCISKDDYDVHEIREILDLSSIQGNVTWLDHEPVPHVHMTMNKNDYTTYSGHIIEAWCHITMEIFIRKLDDPILRRVRIAGVPATRIVRTT